MLLGSPYARSIAKFDQVTRHRFSRFVGNQNQDSGSYARAELTPEESAIANTPEMPSDAEKYRTRASNGDQGELNTSGDDEAKDLRILGSVAVYETENRLEIESANGPDEETVLDTLDQCSIELHNLTWEDNNRTVLTKQELFDLVISDPFHKAAAGNAPVINSDRRMSFTQFVKKVLVPGGYVFLIVPQLEILAWMNTFDEFNFKTESVFTLVKDQESVQRLKGKCFQNLVEVAVVA